MTNEPPENTRLYTIVGWARHTELDGRWWLQAFSDDGTTISVGSLAEGRYEVFVEGPHEPRGRSYSGGEGSAAHERYLAFMGAFEALDGGAPGADTEQRQDGTTASTPKGRRGT